MERKRNFSLVLVLEIHGDTLGPWGVTGWEEVELEGWPHQGGTESSHLTSLPSHATVSLPALSDSHLRL